MKAPGKTTLKAAGLLSLALTLSLAAFPASRTATAADGTEQANPLSGKGSWSDIRGDIIGDAAPADATGIVDIVAPYRAEDAATVPVGIRQTGPTAPMIDKAKLVIDENPAPVAAEMTFGPAMYPLDLELRIRVNQYSNVRLIADTPKGPVMTGRFVKASGGCSAPATKDPQLALSTMGQIRLKSFTPSSGAAGQRREAQIMIRHPNYSGLQRDQITQLFISAHFVDQIEVRQGEELLFTVNGGISLSENPVIRFAYTDNGEKDLTVRVGDTEGNVWKQTLPKDPAS